MPELPNIPLNSLSAPFGIADIANSSGLYVAGTTKAL